MDANATEKRWDVKREAKIIYGLRFDDIKRLILGRLIKEGDLIWHADLSGWRKAGEQEELKPFFNRSGKMEKKKTNKEFTRRKILIIDNEPELLSLIVETLEDEGYQVFSATNGPDGIRLNEQEHPDLIVLDLRMPEMDGIETLRRIRKKDDKVKVIIMTAYGTPDTIRHAIDLDVSEYLGKPFGPEEFVRIIGDELGQAD
ncbi:MAG: response regulator [Kiritimatiellia bacterium]|nr:response regulator [Kiritimatiellia bacterium]